MEWAVGKVGEIFPAVGEEIVDKPGAGSAREVGGLLARQPPTH